MFRQFKTIISNVILLCVVVSFGTAQEDQTFGTPEEINDRFESFIKSIHSDNSHFTFQISSYHFNHKTGLHYIYFQQYFDNQEIYKSRGNYIFGLEKELRKTKRLVWNDELFVKDKSDRSIMPLVEAVAVHLGLPLTKSEGKVIPSKRGLYLIKGLPFATGDITARPVWAKSKDGLYEQALAMTIESSVSSDHWEIVVSFDDQEILYEVNHTLYCSVEGEHADQELHENIHGHQHDLDAAFYPMPGDVQDGSAYNVFPPPMESPDFGGRTLIENPAAEEASPFGWHDTNGILGPEFQNLRGNNVHAYEDIEDRNEPPNSEPSSTVGLLFDFPFNQDSTVDFNLGSDLTNLFYWNNYVHDWSSELGFDEAAGNFQQNNYSNLGRAGDPVLAETLDGK